MGASRAIYALYLKFLTQRNLAAEFHRENVSFTHKTANCRSEPPLFRGGLRDNACDSSLARWKADGRLSVGFKLIIKHFSLALTTEALIR